MIIIKSQDELRIVDCETVIINVNNRKEILSNARISISGEDYSPLGVYETEQRAKEVMAEIEDCIRVERFISKFNTFQYFTKDFTDVMHDFTDNGFIYTMPKI